MNKLFKISSLGIAIFTIGLLLAAPSAQAQRSARVQRTLNLIEFGNPDEAIVEANSAISANAKDHEAWAALGIAYLETGNLAEAEKAIAKGFELERKNGLVRIARGKLYGKRGNVEDALEEFTLAIKYDKNDLDAFLALSRYYFTIDSLKPAEVNLYRAQNANANDVRSFIGLAEMYERQRVYPLAIKQLEEAKKLNPNDLTVRAKLAQLYYRRREFTKSANEWIDLLRIDSTYKRGYYEVANLFFLGEQYPNAASFAQKYVELEPTDCKGHWLYAQALVKINDFVKALPSLNFVASCSDSLRPLTVNLRAQGYVYNKQFDSANQIYSSSKNLSPTDVELWGTSLIYSGDTLGGIGKWRQSLIGDTVRTDSARGMLQLRITSLYQALKRYELAGEFLGELAANETSETNLVKSGQFYLAAGKVTEAANAFNQALTRNPNSLPSLIGLIDVAAKAPDEDAIKTNYDRALPLAQSAADKNMLGEGIGRVAFAFYGSKDYKKTVEWGSKSLSLLSSDSKYLFNVYLIVGSAHVSLKQFDKAREPLNKAKALDPSNEDVKNLLKFLDDNKNAKPPQGGR